jgi:hypothetical protein
VIVPHVALTSLTCRQVLRSPFLQTRI